VVQDINYQILTAAAFDGFFVHVAAYFPEGIFFVEAATGRVLFEHIELKRLANASCKVHQLLTDSPSVMLGIDLVADERDDLKSVVLV